MPFWALEYNQSNEAVSSTVRSPASRSSRGCVPSEEWPANIVYEYAAVVEKMVELYLKSDSLSANPIKKLSGTHTRWRGRDESTRHIHMVRRFLGM